MTRRREYPSERMEVSPTQAGDDRLYAVVRLRTGGLRTYTVLGSELESEEAKRHQEVDGTYILCEELEEAVEMERAEGVDPVEDVETYKLGVVEGDCEGDDLRVVANRVAKVVGRELGAEETKRYIRGSELYVYFEEVVEFGEWERFVNGSLRGGDYSAAVGRACDEALYLFPDYRDRGPKSTKGNRLMVIIGAERVRGAR